MNQNKKITVKDLARICEVSTGTVDRALNGHGRINPETKERILETANSFGYVKNKLARNLSSGSTNLIGAIILNLKNEYFPALLTGIETEARSRGYNTLIMSSGYSAETERECVSELLSMNVAGIIVCSVMNSSLYYERLAFSGTPVITVTNRLGANLPYSGIDDYRAMFDAASYVVSRGYEKIYYIAPVLSKLDQNINAQLLRRDGFLDAVRPTEVRCTIIDSRAGFDALKPDGSVKTALICPSDVYTMKCVARFRGGSVGIMGFDNVESLSVLCPELTTVAYDTSEIGVRAVKLLFDGGSGAVIPYRIKYGTTI